MIITNLHTYTKNGDCSLDFIFVREHCVLNVIFVIVEHFLFVVVVFSKFLSLLKGTCKCAPCLRF